MQNSDQLFLSVIIPAYNEENNIISTLKEVNDYLSKQNYTYEIIIIDDGSNDDTFRLVSSFISGSHYIKLLKNNTNRGKGYSVRRGMLEAKGQYSLFMDADNSTKIYELDKALEAFKERYDVVIASRHIKGAHLDMPQPCTRRVLGKIYHFLSSMLIGVNVSDYNCGFKAYRDQVAKHIFSLQRMNDWSFDTELIFLIRKFNYKVKEIPVNWQHKSTSKVKPFKDGILSFISLLKIRGIELRNNY